MTAPSMPPALGTGPRAKPPLPLPPRPEPLPPEEQGALDALMHASSVVLERSHAADEPEQWFVIDRHFAEPEVDHPGALIGGPMPFEEAQRLMKAERADILLRWKRGEPMRDPYADA